MKIGLFITGHLRDAPITKQNYEQFLNNGDDLSVYVGSWGTYDKDRWTDQLIQNPVDVETKMKNVFGSQLKGTWIGDIVKFENNESPHPDSPPRKLWEEYVSRHNIKSARGRGDEWKWYQRILDQWYVVKQTYLLCPSEIFDSFDVCIRIRGDMSFIDKPQIPFRELLEPGLHVNHYMWEAYQTWEPKDKTELYPFRCSDQLGWATPKYAKKMFEFYDHYIDIFSVLLTKPETTFAFTSEHMFSWYMMKYPFCSIPHDLRKSTVELAANGTSSNTLPNDIPNIFPHGAGWVNNPQLFKNIVDYYDLVNKGTRPPHINPYII